MPAAKRKPSVRLSQERRVSDILAAARAVIADKGYENCLMSDIAERAGVVEGSLYRYFENRRDLLTRAADDWFEEVLSLDSGVTSVQGTSNKLRHLVWRALSTIRSQPALSRFMLLELRPDPNYRASRSFELNRRFTAEVSHICADAIRMGEFRADVPVHLLRDMIFGCIEHATWKFLRGEGDFCAEEVADGIATVIYRGMAAGTAAVPTSRAQPELPDLVDRLARTTATLESLIDPARKRLDEP
jgi:TetR/AcrR family transcriptional regulator, fatty acid metabolism regulator protein